MDDVKASGTVWPWRFDNADADEGATSDDFANTDVAAKTSLWDPTGPTSSHDMYSLMYCVSSCFLVNFFCLSLLGVFTVCCDATSAGLWGCFGGRPRPRPGWTLVGADAVVFLLLPTAVDDLRLSAVAYVLTSDADVSSSSSSISLELRERDGVDCPASSLSLILDVPGKKKLCNGRISKRQVAVWLV